MLLLLLSCDTITWLENDVLVKKSACPAPNSFKNEKYREIFLFCYHVLLFIKSVTRLYRTDECRQAEDGGCRAHRGQGQLAQVLSSLALLLLLLISSVMGFGMCSYASCFQL